MANIATYNHANLETALFAISLDRGGDTPLQTQLITALRTLILSGTARSGMRLPASRTLAAELSVSRMTTVAALDQLAAEGYVETRQGAGTFIAQNLPHIMRPHDGEKPQNIAPIIPPITPHPFQSSTPDLSLFPHAAWARHLERAWRKPAPDLLALPDPMGYAPLRTAIAAHLSAWRGLPCAPDQIIITSGATEAFDHIANALLSPGDIVLTEDPAFPPMLGALRSAGLTPHPHRIDAHGFDIQTAPNAKSARAAVLTPSRQYPMGITLPLPRRLALLEWAKTRNALIVEDDYDSEFRYVGQPLPALATLDTDDRVLYVGSFSKLLSPALRLGYLVVPRTHLPAIRATLRARGTRASLVPQPALARFMQTGEFATHLRKMRRVYARRQACLLRALATHIPDHIIVAPDPSGMHIIARPGPKIAHIPDSEICVAALAAGLALRPLSRYFMTDPQNGFVLGYAGFDEPALVGAVKSLAAIIDAKI